MSNKFHAVREVTAKQMTYKIIFITDNKTCSQCVELFAIFFISGIYLHVFCVFKVFVTAAIPVNALFSCPKGIRCLLVTAVYTVTTVNLMTL